jgi:hypothetical protein
MAKINLNTMAKHIVLEEGGKKSVNIAQVKEVMKLTLEYLGVEWHNGNEEEVIKLIKRSLINKE